MNIQDTPPSLSEAVSNIIAEAKKDNVPFEEGNEFTAAAAKAKLAGKDEFEFEGKKYPVEIKQDAAEKILGKKEETELEEAASFGEIEKVMSWAKKNLVGSGKFPQLDISKKYGTAFINLTSFNIIVLRLGGKKGIVVTHDDRTNGSGKDYEEHFSSANDVIKFVEKLSKKESVKESTDLEEATPSLGFTMAMKKIYSLEKSLKVGSILNKGVNKDLVGKWDPEFRKMQKSLDIIINTMEEIEREYADFNMYEVEEPKAKGEKDFKALHTVDATDPESKK